MPTERTSMRKIKEIMRLRYECGLSNRQIAGSINISSGTVSRYLSKITAANIQWPLPEELSEDELEAKVFTRSSTSKALAHLTPDLSYIHQELKKKHVTKQLLWDEYVSNNPGKHYSYSQFCMLYREWCGEHKISMRQTHYAGEKLFVDYAGHTIPIYSKNSDEVLQAQIFIAVLGASNYTYAEATMTQELSNWISSNVRAFEFLGGVPKIVVPDNLKSAIAKPCRYEPDINLTYLQMAQHYNIAVIPARTYKPKDKAKVEGGVLIVSRWILARLRNHKFYSLAELNAVIKALLEDLNNRQFKKLPGSRRSTFIEVDKPALQPLPKDKYQFTEIKKATVHIDYHIEIDRRYYSVPYNLVKKKVEAHITNNTVSIYYKGSRVASHAKVYRQGQQSTIVEHMPIKHQKYHDWHPGRFLNWANEIGPATGAVIKDLLQKRMHPEQSYRSCFGVLDLEKKYSKPRLESACARAVHIGAMSRKSVISILKNGLDQVPLTEPKSSILTENHENIRGSQYYT